MSRIRDINLAPSGENKIEWVKRNCPLLRSLEEEFSKTKPFAGKKIALYEADIRDNQKLSDIFKAHQIDAVIHFAGLKAVGESVQKPLMYYRNNIDTTLTLLEVMQEYGVQNIIFSSSATVYGEANPVPYLETMPRGACTNPYGWTKSMMEQIFEDAAKALREVTVKGRVQVLPVPPERGTFIIDYAHNALSMESILKMLIRKSAQSFGV